MESEDKALVCVFSEPNSVRLPDASNSPPRQTLFYTLPLVPLIGSITETAATEPAELPSASLPTQGPALGGCHWGMMNNL